MKRWRMSGACAVLLGVVLAICLGGCASNSAEPEPEPVTGSSMETTPTVEAPAPASDLYPTAASTANFTVYEPTYIPDGFVLLEDERKVAAGLVGISYGRGDDRLLVLQGVWDLGGDAGKETSTDATFGDMNASVIEGGGTNGSPPRTATRQPSSWLHLRRLSRTTPSSPWESTDPRSSPSPKE